MKVEEKSIRTSGSPTLVLKDMSGDTIEGGHILLIASNNIFFESHSDQNGICIFANLQNRIYSIYVAHPNYPAYVIDDFAADKDLTISINRIDGDGSLICPDGTGYIPGIDGRLNPILDTHGRTYLYADNISINGGAIQPATFEVGKPFRLEDRFGNRAIINFLRMKGRSSLIQYKKMEAISTEMPQRSGSKIEAGNEITMIEKILANKEQFMQLKNNNLNSYKRQRRLLKIFNGLTSALFGILGYLYLSAPLSSFFSSVNKGWGSLSENWKIAIFSAIMLFLSIVFSQLFKIFVTEPLSKILKKSIN